MDAAEALSEKDARTIIRLLGDVAALEGGIPEQKTFLMNGLSSLVVADSWVWATACKFEVDQIPLNSGILSGGFSPKQFAKFLEAIEHPDIAILNQGLTRELEEKKTHLTRLRDQIDDSRHFYSSNVYPLWIAASIEQVIMSVRPGPNESMTSIGLYRRPGCPPFTARDSRIAHIVLSEVAWLYSSILSVTVSRTVSQLSPRQRVILNLLLEGHSRKQIAAHLELSYQTVNDHIKAVYRYFQIHSQAGLIARFQHGDHGDIP